MGEHMPELKTFAQLDEQQRREMKELYAGLRVLLSMVRRLGVAL